MKSKFALTLLLTLVYPITSKGSAAETSPDDNTVDNCTLMIHVDGLRNSNGVVGSVIFKSPEGWPEDTTRSFRHGPTPIPSGERQSTVVWAHLPSGDYGVAVIHDENRNARLDRNMFGIPKEGFGFANNPHVVLSAPAFKVALVHLLCPTTETAIHIQYK